PALRSQSCLVRRWHLHRRERARCIRIRLVPPGGVGPQSEWALLSFAGGRCPTHRWRVGPALRGEGMPRCGRETAGELGASLGTGLIETALPHRRIPARRCGALGRQDLSLPGRTEYVVPFAATAIRKEAANRPAVREGSFLRDYGKLCGSICRRLPPWTPGFPHD